MEASLPDSLQVALKGIWNPPLATLLPPVRLASSRETEVGSTGLYDQPTFQAMQVAANQCKRNSARDSISHESHGVLMLKLATQAPDVRRQKTKQRERIGRRKRVDNEHHGLHAMRDGQREVTISL